MSIERTKTTDWRPLNSDGERIRATYGFHYLRGDGRPYFSITAEIVDKRGRDIGGGCCHEDIARVFPELADLIPWHLSDDDARPMHDVANGQYWLEFHHGISRWKFDEYGQFERQGKTPLDVFKGHAVLADGESLGNLLDPLEPVAPDGVNVPLWELSPAYHDAQREILSARVQRWFEARQAAMAERMNGVMAKHGVKYIEPREYGGDE